MAGRSPFQQPFLPTSIWNIPIGSFATYANPQPTASQNTLFPATIRTMTSDDNVVLMDPSQPLTTIAQSTSFKSRCTVGATLTTVPCGANFTVSCTAPGNDALSAVKQDGITLVGGDGGAVFKVSGTQTITLPSLDAAGSLYDAGLGTSGPNSDGPYHGGSGLSGLGGVIRLGELVVGGGIPHAIAMNINAGVNCFNGFVWPAWKKDSYTYSPGGTNPKLAPGTLLAIPPGVFAGMTFQSTPGKMVATALMNYGAYVVNDAARSVNTFCTEWSPNGFVAEPLGTAGQFETTWGMPFNTAGVGGTTWGIDMIACMAALMVVTNNTQANYNLAVSNYATGNPAKYTGAGGGAPLVSLAPPLGGSAFAPFWSNTSVGSEQFVPITSAPSTGFNPNLQFAALSSEAFDITFKGPVTIGPTIACGTQSLSQTTLMRVN